MIAEVCATALLNQTCMRDRWEGSRVRDGWESERRKGVG